MTRQAHHREGETMTSLIPRSAGFGDLFRRREEGVAVGGRHVVKVEEYRQDRDYAVRAELAGVDPAKDIDVQVDGDVLTISAERSTSRREHGHSEFAYGSFSRSVRLP